jgi:single-strand DNA-binding protein
VTLPLATTEKWTDKQGQKQEKTEWHRVTLYNRLAELAGQYVGKGSKLYIEGKIVTNSWEKDGEKRYSTEIVANSMQFLSSKPEGQPQQQQQQPQYSQPQQSPDPFDDDIPF